MRVHAVAPLAWGLSPLADQQLGGLIMWVPAGLPFFAFGALLARRAVARHGGRAGVIGWLEPVIPHLKALHIVALLTLVRRALRPARMLARHDPAIGQADYARIRRATHYGYTYRRHARRRVLAIASGTAADLPARRLRAVDVRQARLRGAASSRSTPGSATRSSRWPRPSGTHTPPEPLLPSLILVGADPGHPGARARQARAGRDPAAGLAHGAAGRSAALRRAQTIVEDELAAMPARRRHHDHVEARQQDAVGQDRRLVAVQAVAPVRAEQRQQQHRDHEVRPGRGADADAGHQQKLGAPGRAREQAEQEGRPRGPDAPPRPRTDRPTASRARPRRRCRRSARPGKATLMA